MAARSLRRIILSLALALAAGSAQSKDWPEGYVIHKDSVSPDGSLCIIIPGPDGDSGSSSDRSENYLANPKTRKVLGEIENSDYFRGQNHAGLEVLWSQDSKDCVLTYEARYGFGHIIALHLGETGMQQSELTQHIGKAVEKAVGSSGTGSAHFRYAPGHKLLVRTTAFTGNPKFLDETSKSARFEGTYDLIKRKWLKSKALQTVGFDHLEALYSAGDESHMIVSPDGKTPEDFTGSVFSSYEAMAESLDKDLNTVYSALRTVIPAAQFEKVKADQIAWLKKRDAADTIEDKCKLIQSRIKALEDLAWEP